MDGVSEAAETIRGAQIATDIGCVPADHEPCRGDGLEEWFAQAAAGAVPDEGDSPGHVLLAAATLPVHGGTLRSSRSRRGSLRVPGAARLRRVRGRVLALAAMVSLVVLVVVTVVVTGSLGSSSTSSPMPEVVTSARAPIDKLGDIVERSLTAMVACQKRAGQRRHTALQAARRKANERRGRVERRVLVAGHRANVRARVAVHARAVAPASAGRGASRRARLAPAQTRQRQRRSVQRRSPCGPFDLC